MVGAQEKEAAAEPKPATSAAAAGTEEREALKPVIAAEAAVERVPSADQIKGGMSVLPVTGARRAGVHPHVAQAVEVHREAVAVEVEVPVGVAEAVAAAVVVDERLNMGES
jgi:hypothetical protein